MCQSYLIDWMKNQIKANFPKAIISWVKKWGWGSMIFLFLPGNACLLFGAILFILTQEFCCFSPFLPKNVKHFLHNYRESAFLIEGLVPYVWNGSTFIAWLPPKSIFSKFLWFALKRVPTKNPHVWTINCRWEIGRKRIEKNPQLLFHDSGTTCFWEDHSTWWVFESNCLEGEFSNVSGLPVSRKWFEGGGGRSK